jgi:tetratricopeptide (TPR) repeat protein
LILVLAALLATAPASNLAPAIPRAGSCSGAATPDALICRALQAQHGDPDTAAADFEQAARASPAQALKTARLWAAAGNMWIAANQPGKAAFALDQALAVPGLEAEQRGEVLLDRARAAEAQGDLKTARARLGEAAQSIPDDPFYWYFSAALAIREGDSATAKTAIAKALALAPSDPSILFEAGHVADLAGDDDQARSYWLRAEAADPAGDVGKAAAKALEMLGVTPKLAPDAQPPR